MSNIFCGQVGLRYQGVLSEASERKSGSTTPMAGETGKDAVLEFVAHLYNLIRDDAAMVAKLDRALKERYGQR